MSKNAVDELFTQVMKLDPPQRAALITRLLEEIDEHDLRADAELDVEWMPEWEERRNRRLAAGDDYLIDAESAMQRIRASLPPRG